MKNISFTTIYYGWKNLLGSFLTAAVAISFTTYAFGMFAVPVTEEFGISRANFNNGMIAFMIGMALLAPVVGHFLDKYSARSILLLGGMIFGPTLMLISRLDSQWLMLFLIGVPLAFATGACGMLNANTVTVRWFLRRRGRALGILALSTSVGGFFAQPLTALLIDSFGWRNALFILGVIATLVFLAMGFFVIRDRPAVSDPGYGEEHAPAEGGTGNQPQANTNEERLWHKGELFRNRNFWILSICIGLLFGIDQAVLISQVAYFQDIGFTLKTTALLVSVKTISAIFGKLIIGFLADKIDLRWLLVYVACSNALLMTIYILQPSFWILLICVALLGVAVGGVFPVWTTLMAWLFGARSYGTVMGLMSIIMQPFAVVTLRFIGEIYDRTGSYVPAFAVFIGLAISTIGLVWLLKPEQPGKPETDH